MNDKRQIGGVVTDALQLRFGITPKILSQTKKLIKSSTREMSHSTTTLFVSPKRGGILQSSGFLNLKSLMALGQTCKANAFDELSLILLIENEITRHHGVKTMQEAIAFWRKVNDEKEYPLFRPWLERDGSTAELYCTMLPVQITLNV